ncbi:MAG: 50S ribosomal protein L30 [Candidatus Aminicenantes bacterium]|nr:50S ribosomal protein L30 [Candidatus Aminicenantes bacterium]MCK5005330.1 50S ribosomal protein L30 [Candidatus Aminicenantes bacterium]
MIKIALRKSLIGRTEKQRLVVKGLGLRKINSEVVKEKSPEIMGMVNKIDFLLEVTEVSK